MLLVCDTVATVIAAVGEGTVTVAFVIFTVFVCGEMVATVFIGSSAKNTWFAAPRPSI